MRMVQVAPTPDERKILVCLWRFGNIRSPAALDAARGNEVTQFQHRFDRVPYCCAAASQEAVQVRRDAETAPAACAISSQQLSGSLQARQASEEEQPLDIGPS